MKISQEIQQEAEINNINVQRLPPEAAKKILCDIGDKYINKNAVKGLFLWEKLNDFSYIVDVYGWKYIKDFIAESTCLLFFNTCDDKAIITFKNGADLHKILNETYGFEFYITNLETDYLICFNHHDCLMASGRAKKWIESLKQSGQSIEP